MSGRLRRLRVLGVPTLFVVAFLIDFVLQRWLLARGAWGHDPFFVRSFVITVANAYHLLLMLATFLAPPAVLERMFRGARPGKAWRWSTPVFAARHPVLVHRVLPWLPGGLFASGWLVRLSHMFAHGGIDYVLHSLPRLSMELMGLGLALPAMAALTRLLVRQQLAEPAVVVRDTPDVADESTFAAVAVTRTTKGVVGALGLVSFAMILYTAAAAVNAAMLALLTAYVAGALGAATLFRRASRITVGIDGVLVRGAGRTRFHGYASLDDVQQSRNDILLLRRGRIVLRLQLHDADVARADVLVARFRSAMGHAARMRADGAGRLMETATTPGARRSLAASAEGGIDYRSAAVPREHLWELVEGPASDATSRTVAAQAIAEHAGDDERARLRIAAEHCAQPLVRIALERIADGEDEELVYMPSPGPADVVSAPNRAAEPTSARGAKP